MSVSTFQTTISRISRREVPGAVLCFLIATYLLFYFSLLDTWYLQLCGSFTIAFYLVIPILSLSAIRAMRKASVETDRISTFAKAKQRFFVVQKLALGLGAVLIFASLPVFSKILSGIDLFQDFQGWGWFVLGTILLLLFGRWSYGNYKKIADSAELILREG